MIFWGVLPEGDQLLLGEPEEAVLTRDRDAPADMLRAKFPAASLWEECREVFVYDNGKLLFRGIVDEQNTLLTSAGLTVELVCRSLEALLLDNEAPPGTFSVPSLAQLETKLLAPLGLAFGEGDREKKRGELTVEKGESCWTVLERFCLDFLGAAPFVDLEGRVRCGGIPEETIELAEVISAQVSRLPCRYISEVWQQSCRGEYDTLYRGGRKRIFRRRYSSMQGGKDPRQILAQGERESFLLTVTCAGAVWPGRNVSASVTIPGVGRFAECPVRNVLYRRSKAGESTRFVLERGKEK